MLVPPIQQFDYGCGQRFFHLTADEYYRHAFSPGRASEADSIEPIQLFQKYTATTVGYTGITTRLLASHDFDFFGVYLETSDSMSHLFMKYAPPRRP